MDLNYLKEESKIFKDENITSPILPVGKKIYSF